jgi:L-amino acid N-acyltransferase YncA
MQIRNASIYDIQAINAIVNYYINHTFANWSWSERAFEEVTEWFHAHSPEGSYPLFVADCDGVIAGYASLSPFRNKDGYRNIAENSVYLLPEYRGRGIGRQLMERLISHAKNSGLWVITAWIDASNQNSIAFHEKFGFELVGEMKNIGQKWDKECSLVIMNLDLRKESS